MRTRIVFLSLLLLALSSCADKPHLVSVRGQIFLDGTQKLPENYRLIVYDERTFGPGMKGPNTVAALQLDDDNRFQFKGWVCGNAGIFVPFAPVGISLDPSQTLEREVILTITEDQIDEGMFYLSTSAFRTSVTQATEAESQRAPPETRPRGLCRQTRDSALTD